MEIVKELSQERTSDIPENNVIHQRSMFAYEHAKSLIVGKDALDLGCGLAYGTSLMAENAKTLIGLDYDSEVVQHNSAKYASISQLSFKAAPVPPIPFPDNTFDFVTSFQFIEHLHERLKLIQEIKRVLKPGGMMMLTTPNILKSNARNPFHVHEYTFAEMRQEVASVFNEFTLKGLKGNEKINRYMEENGKWVRQILQFDILGLHKRIPASWLIVPYNFMTRLMRKKLATQNTDTAQITTADYFLSENQLDTAYDIYVFASK